MTTYNVHLYRAMRLVFLGVEAASQEEAAHRVFQLPSDAAESFEDCEGRNLGALVDVRGDRDHMESKMFDSEDGRLLAAAPTMFAALQEIAKLNSMEALRAGHVLSVSPNVAVLALGAIAEATGVVPSSSDRVLCEPYPESIIRDRLASYDALEVHPVRTNPQPDGSTWRERCAAHEADIWSVYAHLAEGGVDCIGDFETEALALAYARAWSAKCSLPIACGG